MPTIQFTGVAAERLTANLGGRIALLKEAVESLRRNGPDDPLAKAWMVECLVCAAWGVNDGPYKPYGGRIQRFEQLSRYNEHIYCLTRSDRPVVLSIRRSDGRWEDIDFGDVTGFSAVLPLTVDGFRHYFFRTKAATELVEEDIVPGGYRPHSVDFVMLAAAVDVPTLRRYLRGVSEFPAKSPSHGGTIHRLFADMARQLGRFLPFVKLTMDEKGLVRAESGRPTGRLPTLVCPLSGRGMGEPNLEKAGFEYEGRDKRGNALWKLDFDDLEGSKNTDRFRRIYKTFLYINRFR
jgi:hypothetical protein